MRFENRRFITRGVMENIPLHLQFFLWLAIEVMPPEKDYLQVFEFVNDEGKNKIIHTQEIPEYRKEYLLTEDTPIFMGKVFVIDDETHTTMLLANEY